MPPTWTVWSLTSLVLLAGCTTPPASPGPVDAPDVGNDHVPLACRVVDTAGDPVPSAVCRFTGSGDQRVPVDDDGVAEVDVPRGEEVLVSASAPGRTGKSLELVADAPKRVTFTLPEAAAPPVEGAGTGPEPAPGPASDPVADGTGNASVAPPARNWTAPVTVTDAGNEPHLTVAADGTVYYSPTNDLYRSTDGGTTWTRVSPGPTEALPVLAGDTSVHVAPDGSVWWSRYWGYAGTTVGCTSTDRGDSWTCDNAAVPGVTDRMWIVGLDAERGYLQTNEGLYHHVWAYTDAGSVKYVPHATTTTLLAVRNGNMVYDATRDAVWQIEFTGDTHKLLRVDGAPGLVSSRDTGLAATYALPWLAIHDGVLWTTAEPEAADGSRSVTLARSTDGGARWDAFPIQSAAASVTFSYAAAGPDGRVAAVYYGSDTPGPSTRNGGTWSLYVVETDNGLDPEPTWVETRLVDRIHEGNVCIGLNCEDSGDDPAARFSGDLIGAWIDDDGLIHLAYNDDTDGLRNQYLRQV